MDATVLRLALQFGNGTHLEEEQHTGIGRFGMGLPSSSVSQCQKVEVWTWQNDVDNALYTYLDLNEIKTQRISLDAFKLDRVHRIFNCFSRFYRQVKCEIA